MQFKILLGALCVFYGLVRAIYQFQYRKKQRLKIIHPLRENILVTMVAIGWWAPVILFIFTDFIQIANVALPEWIRYIGAAILFISIVYFWRVHYFLGHNWSPVLEVDAAHTLIETGPYSLVRHPMYSVFFASIVGISVTSGNWIVAITSFGSFLLLYLVRVPSEEEMMLETFGERYATYCSRTGRLFPRLNKSRFT